MIKGFLTFIREQGTIGLAVGFLLGGAVSKLVTSLVTDIINPILAPVFGAAGNIRTAVLARFTYFGETFLLMSLIFLSSPQLYILVSMASD